MRRDSPSILDTRAGRSFSGGAAISRRGTRNLRPTSAAVARAWAPRYRTEASHKQLESLLGEWAWSLLAFRPLFSVFFSVYRFVRLAGSSASPFSIWPSVRREFFVQLALLPLLRARLSRPVGSRGRVYFTDASSIGGAVVSRPVSLPHVTCVAVDTSRVWKYPAHINELEFRSVLEMLGLAEKGHTHQLRVDSQVVLGILRKGRSSSWSLNKLSRKAAGLQLARGVGVNVVYVPSAENPADGPSRGEGGTAALQRYLDEWL